MYSEFSNHKYHFITILLIYFYYTNIMYLEVHENRPVES